MQYQIDNFKVLASNQTDLKVLVKNKFIIKGDFNYKIINKCRYDMMFVCCLMF